MLGLAVVAFVVIAAEVQDPVDGQVGVVRGQVLALLLGLADEPPTSHEADAFAVAVACNFWGNRRWTFAPSDRAAGPQAARFFLVSVVAFLFVAVVP